MTTGVGHPDWQSYAQWRSGHILLVTDTVAVGATYTSAAFNSTQWQSLLVKALAGTGGGQLRMQTASVTTAPDASWTTERTWDLPPGSNEIVALVAPRDRCVRFQIVNYSSTVGCSFAFSVDGANSPVNSASSPVPTDYVTSGLFSLTTGSTETISPAHQGFTRAQIYAATPAATASGVFVDLFVLNPDGTLGDPLAEFLDIKGATNFSLVVPVAPLALRMKNGTAGTVSNCRLGLTLAY